MRGFGILTASALMLGASAGAALADLSYCNASAGPIRLAVAEAGQGYVTSQGWYKLAPGACNTVHYGEFDANYYYLTDEPGFRGNGHTFCLGTEENFWIDDSTNCQAQGFRGADFRQVAISGPNDSILLNLDGAGAGGGPTA